MINRQGAMAIAEGSNDYKVDCSLLLNNGSQKKDFVLRTTFDSLSVWKAKHNVPLSPFKGSEGMVTKEAALIDNEIWVFGINATSAEDVVLAVKIGMKYYKVKAKEIIGDVYVKNLNTEHEKGMGDQARVNANKDLYSGVCKALIGAAKLLGVQGEINFWVLSNNKNPKIPKEELHNALKSGGAESTVTDDKTKHAFFVARNDGSSPGFKIKTNLHLAKLKI